MIPSTSTYSFRSIYEPYCSHAASAGQLLPPAVIISEPKEEKTGLFSKIKRLAGKVSFRTRRPSFQHLTSCTFQSRKNGLSKSASHLDLSLSLSASSPTSLNRSTNTLSSFPLRTSSDHNRASVLSPTRHRSTRGVNYNAVPLSKSASSHSMVSIRDIQDFASSLFPEATPSRSAPRPATAVDPTKTPDSSDMAREWTVRGLDVYPRSSAYSLETPSTGSSSSSRSSFSSGTSGPITPGTEHASYPFWPEGKDKVVLTMGRAKKPMSPVVVQNGWMQAVPLDGIWNVPEDEDNQLLQKQFERVMGIAI